MSVCCNDDRHLDFRKVESANTESFEYRDVITQVLFTQSILLLAATIFITLDIQMAVLVADTVKKKTIETLIEGSKWERREMTAHQQ